MSKPTPKIRFVGDPNDKFSGPDEITVWGEEFRKGKFTDVSAEIVELARTHSHFEIEGEKADPKPAE